MCKDPETLSITDHVTFGVMLFCFVLLIASVVPLAFAVPGETCVEDGTYCNFADAPFEAMIEPYQIILGSWTYVIMWGAILGVLWLWTQSPGIVAVVGVVISSFLIGIVPEALYIGIFLVAISIGIYMFSIFTKAQYS